MLPRRDRGDAAVVSNGVEKDKCWGIFPSDPSLFRHNAAPAGRGPEVGLAWRKIPTCRATCAARGDPSASFSRLRWNCTTYTTSMLCGLELGSRHQESPSKLRNKSGGRYRGTIHRADPTPDVILRLLPMGAGSCARSRLPSDVGIPPWWRFSAMPEHLTPPPATNATNLRLHRPGIVCHGLGL